MNIHKNARLTPKGRAIPVRRIVEEGLRVEEAAQASGVSTQILLRVIAFALSLAFTGMVHAAPFDGLHTIKGADTSRNGQWISITISTEDYRAKVPGYEETVTRAMGPDHDAILLSVTCRAGPATEHFKPQPARAEILIPDHPDQQPHNWWSPMFWLLGLAGTAVEETPVNATLADANDPGKVWHAEPATIERLWAEYSAARTMLSVWIDGPATLAVFAKGQAIQVQITGSNTDARGTFPAAPQLAGVARTMMRHCPKAQGAASD